VSAGLGRVEAVPAFADGRHDLGGFGRMLQAAAHPDAREALRGGSAGSWRCTRLIGTCRACCCRWPCSTPPRSAARSSGWNKAGRAERPASLSAWLTQEALRADVTAGQAADLLWLLTSFDSFDLLYTGRDLSTGKTATTLITTAERSLCR
jgi:hypothetical protein